MSQSKDTSVPKTVENVQIFPCAGFIWFFISSYINSYIKEALSCFRAAQGTIMLAHFFPMKKKGLPVMYLILLPHVLTLFIMTLIQTAGHIVAAFMVMFV